MAYIAQSEKMAAFVKKLYELVSAGVREAYAYRREFRGRQPVGMEFIRSGVSVRRLVLTVRLRGPKAFSILVSESSRGCKIEINCFDDDEIQSTESYGDAPKGLALNLLCFVENEISKILENESAGYTQLELPLRTHA